MDIKLGTRTHPDDATPEKAQHQIDKVNRTTSKSLGVRICGIKVYQPKLERYREIDKYEGRKYIAENIAEKLAIYFQNGIELRKDLVELFLEKLGGLLQVVERQEPYRIYSSSLLFVYEGLLGHNTNKTELKMIDFAHIFLRREGEMQDDGYKFGLKNLIKLMEGLQSG